MCSQAPASGSGASGRRPIADTAGSVHHTEQAVPAHRALRAAQAPLTIRIAMPSQVRRSGRSPKRKTP